MATVRLKGATPKKGLSDRSPSLIRPPGALHVVAVHVRPEGPGTDPGVEGAARHVEAEVRAVPDVDLDPAGKRLLDDRVDLPRLAGDEAARMAGEGMGEHVAGVEQGDGFLDVGVGVDRDPVPERPELPRGGRRRGPPSAARCPWRA